MNGGQEQDTGGGPMSPTSPTTETVPSTPTSPGREVFKNIKVQENSEIWEIKNLFSIISCNIWTL